MDTKGFSAFIEEKVRAFVTVVTNKTLVYNNAFSIK